MGDDERDNPPYRKLYESNWPSAAATSKESNDGFGLKLEEVGTTVYHYKWKLTVDALRRIAKLHDIDPILADTLPPGDLQDLLIEKLSGEPMAEPFLLPASVSSRSSAN